MAPAAARVAHTTVSDVFRTGRSRVNVNLVAEVVYALTQDEQQAAEWRARARAAAALGQTKQPAPSASEKGARDLPAVAAGRVRWRGRSLALLIVTGMLLNATGKFLNPLVGDLLFLDMVGTATVALLAGPWASAVVGAMFVATELLKGEVGNALFAVTMVTAGLLWGYGAHRFNLARSLPRFLALSGVVALVTSAIAVPIIGLYYGGHTGRGLDVITSGVAGNGVELWLAIGGANLAVSVVDKLLVGAIAFMLMRSMASRTVALWAEGTPVSR